MLSKNSFKWVLPVSVFLLSIGCQPRQLPNQPPIAVDMIVSPVTVQAGSTADITVIANDPDRDPLAYYWSANKGSVPGGNRGEAIIYTAPLQGGLDTITVLISDGKQVTSRSISVSVLDPEIAQEFLPSPTPTPTPSPTELSVSPSITPTRLDSLSPPPTSTSTPPPTSTSTPPPTSTSTPTPTPTFTPTPVQSPEPTRLQPLIEDSSNTIMSLVPAGPFMMGSDPSAVQEMCTGFYGQNRPECAYKDFEDEAPTHQVILSDYYIDLYEVTNAHYARCVADGVCAPPFANTSAIRDGYFGSSKYSEYPVVHISWSQAQAYCAWRGAKLPTEAEWEKAARGMDSFIYPWGSDKPEEELLNFNSIVGDTTPVGSYPKGTSPYGIFDMAGNVSEWVADTFSSYPSGEIINPSGPSSGTRKVIRGGGWYSSGLLVRSAERTWAEADLVYYNVGFRCAITP